MIFENDPPQKIGPYRRLTPIGEGGMGVVYRGVDPAGRDVAVKVLKPELAADPTGLPRLAREIETMRRVRSPHVAEVLDGQVHARPPYVVTRFVPGRRLDDIVAADGPLRGAALHRLALGLARALVAVHEAGVVHRDLKPSNVMLVDDGEPVVIDFGIAQSLDSTRLTLNGMVAGTPGYVAPEVFDEERATPASDVHAWAATVVFAATGNPPFGRGSIETVFYNVMNGRAQLEGVPEPLLPLLRSALNRDPTWRPTAPALLEAVANLVVEPADGADGATVLDARTPAPTPAPMPPPAPAPLPPGGTGPVTAASQPASTAYPGVPQQGPVTGYQNGPHPPQSHQLPPPQQPPGPPHQRGRLNAGHKWVLIAAGVLATFGLLGGGLMLLQSKTAGADPASTTTTTSSQPSAQPSAPAVVASPGVTAPTSAEPSIEVPVRETVRSTQNPRGGAPVTTRPTRPRPRPTGTSSASASPAPRIVTPGAFCAPEGATGVTSTGTPMRCTLKEGETQPRWRSAA